MKRIKDSTLPDEWFANGKGYLLNEPEEPHFTTLWKAVLWSGSGYTLAPYLFYADDDMNDALNMLGALLEKNGINGFFVDDFYFNNPDIDEYVAEADCEDVYDYMDYIGDYYVDSSSFGAHSDHVIRGENFKMKIADEPIEYYMGSDEISDSRKRVKDSDDDNDDNEDNNGKYEFAVAIDGSESMSNDEGRKYAKEMSKVLSGNQYDEGGNWCETDWVEPMDRVGKGESVAVWGFCYADSENTVYDALEMWVEDWADKYGFELRITVQDAID